MERNSSFITSRYFIQGHSEFPAHITSESLGIKEMTKGPVDQFKLSLNTVFSAPHLIPVLLNDRSLSPE